MLTVGISDMANLKGVYRFFAYEIKTINYYLLFKVHFSGLTKRYKTYSVQYFRDLLRRRPTAKYSNVAVKDVSFGVKKVICNLFNYLIISHLHIFRFFLRPTQFKDVQ